MAKAPLSKGAIRKVKEGVEDQLLALPGVQGVDINEKISKGQGTGELSIVVYVKKKKPKTRLAKGEAIPAEIDGIPTDIQEEEIELQGASMLLADAEPLIDTGTYTPLRGGISMGPCRSVYLAPPDVPTAGYYVFTGTFGAVVKDRSTGDAMALTNFHVACIDDGWSAGDTMAQPSRVDTGSCPSDRFGTLTRAVLNEDVDGAVVKLDSGKTYDCSIEEIGGVMGTVAASYGMAVRKRGRTTELTYGTVNSTDMSVTVDYGDGLGVRTLKKQIRVVPDTTQNPRFSDKGDSGSVVVDGNRKVLGLLFAGSTSGSATYLNPIQKALDALNVDLCTKGFSIVTNPKVCGPLVTHPVICYVVTQPRLCHIVTRPQLCQILTAPRLCQIKTLACPVRTFACPPFSLACGWDRRFPPRGWFRSDGSPASDESPAEAYGRPDADGGDEAFWLGYYSALEALSEAEEDESDD